MTIDASDILSVTKSVTKEWTRQRKLEERGSSSRWLREEIYSDRVNCTDIADAILPRAYDHASGGGKFTVSKRQLHYACREKFKERTGRELSARLLLEYVARSIPESTPRNCVLENHGRSARDVDDSQYEI